MEWRSKNILDITDLHQLSAKQDSDPIG